MLQNFNVLVTTRITARGFLFIVIEITFFIEELFFGLQGYVVTGKISDHIEVILHWLLQNQNEEGKAQAEGSAVMINLYEMN